MPWCSLRVRRERPLYLASALLALAGVTACQSNPPAVGDHADARARSASQWPFRFAGAQDALWFAAAQVLAASRREDREYGGAIVRLADASHVITLGSAPAGSDAISLRVQLAKGAHIVAFWHSHGAAGAQRDYFSAADAELAQRTGLPFYLVTPSGELKVVRADDHGGRLTARSSVTPDLAFRGIHVGWVRPHEVLLALPRPLADMPANSS